MNNFQPFWCMLLGDQAGKRISSRGCIAIHRALKYTAAMGYDVEPRDHDLRCWLRDEEDEDTTAAEYATIILRYQKNRILERHEENELVMWASYLYDTGFMRSHYRWKMIRDLLEPPKHNRGLTND